MRSPETATGIADSGLSAGPLITSPVAASNFEPWQGQSNSSPAAATTHCWCVQIALNATTCPAVGCAIERRLAVDGGVDAAADRDVGERRDVLADGRRRRVPRSRSVGGSSVTLGAGVVAVGDVGLGRGIRSAPGEREGAADGARRAERQDGAPGEVCGIRHR